MSKRPIRAGAAWGRAASLAGSVAAATSLGGSVGSTSLIRAIITLILLSSAGGRAGDRRARQHLVVAIPLVQAACGAPSDGPPPPPDPTAPDAPFDEIRALVEAYKAAHPGNGGKDWDV